MRLPYFFYTLRLCDVPGIACAVLLLALVVFVSVKYPTAVAKLGMGWKFGPGWSCQYVAQGEPICIKDVPKGPAN